MVNRSWLIYSDFLNIRSGIWRWSLRYMNKYILFSYLFDTVASMFRSQKKNVTPVFYFGAFQFNIYIKKYMHTIFCWKKSNSNLNLMRKWMLYVRYVMSQNICYITLVYCMIVFRYLLYLILYFFFKYVTYTYSQYWNKLSIS